MALITPSTYLTRLPKVLPADRVLVHNHVRPTRRLGSRGFRAWLSPPSERLTVCRCGWAAELGQHFRVKLIQRSRLRNPTPAHVY
jgi:hypothetical protein